jgi:damage-control phosphatase, subfamily I
MKASLDCIPCFIRQTLDASKLISTEPSEHKKIMREIIGFIGNMDLDRPPPVLGQAIHRRIREVTCVEDPYREAKEHQNRMALSLFPMLKAEMDASSDPLMTAVRLTIAGNILSMTASGKVTESDVHNSIRQGLKEPSYMQEEAFKQAVYEAKNILYLADNAGEIVFDRLLIERLLPVPVTIAVRGGPVINDATVQDAYAAGLNGFVEIIDNGSDAPGIILEDCSLAFNRRFADADLIISKGQGNFETLNYGRGNIFFLFKVKCPVIAAHVGMPVGTHVLRQQSAGS